MLHALHENELAFLNDGKHIDVFQISSLLSLGVIIVTLVVTAVASLAKDKKDLAAQG